MGVAGKQVLEVLRTIEGVTTKKTWSPPALCEP